MCCFWSHSFFKKGFDLSFPFILSFILWHFMFLQLFYTLMASISTFLHCLSITKGLVFIAVGFVFWILQILRVNFPHLPVCEVLKFGRVNECPVDRDRNPVDSAHYGWCDIKSNSKYKCSKCGTWPVYTCSMSGREKICPVDRVRKPVESVSFLWLIYLWWIDLYSTS